LQHDAADAFLKTAAGDRHSCLKYPPSQAIAPARTSSTPPVGEGHDGWCFRFPFCRSRIKEVRRWIWR